MNLLDLMVKIGVDDRASDQISSLTTGAIARATAMGNAIYDVVKGGVGAMVDGAKTVVGGAMQGYASFEQLSGGIAKLYGNAGMSLEEYADSVGKTTDEVAAEYQRNEDAQAAMMENARNAYKNTGQSANEYMTNATQFSSSLIKSLGGDTKEAARLTDVAMRAISDNVNTFGSNAKDATNAVIGLSRQNYTMLDNLKLGYSGTQQGMLELINDSGVLGEKLTSTSQLAEVGFDKMVEAIQAVQEQQGIAGTTTREAMTTIEGSVNSAKASWENLLTAIGSGDQTMIQESVTGLVDSIFGTFSEVTGKREGGVINSVLPVLQNVGKALVGAIPGVAENMVWNLMEVINDTFGTDFDVEEIMVTLENAFGRVVTAVTDFVSALTGSTDLSGFQTMFDTVMTVAGQVFTFLTEHATEIGTVIGTVITVVGQVAEVATNLFNVVSPYLPFIATLIGTFGVLMPVINGVVGVIGAISGAVTFLTTVVLPALGMIQSIPGLIAVVTSVLGGPITIIAAIAAAIVAFVATNEDARNAILNALQAVVDFFMGLPETLGNIWEGIKTTFGEWVEAWKQSWTDFKTGAEEKWNETVEWVTGIPDRARDALGDIGSTLLEAGRSLLGGLWDGMSEKADELFGWVGGIADTIASLKGPLPYDEKVLVDNGSALMDGLSSGIAGRFDSEIVPYLTSMAGSIADNIGDLGGLLYGAGSALMDGLFDGMMQAASGMLDWVAGLANQIAYLKGPLPYDRKVLIENGMALMSGLRRGLGEGFEREVMPYVSTLAEQMQDSIESQPLMSPSLSYEYTAVPASRQQGPATVRDDAVVSLLTAILSTMPQGVYLDKRTLVGQLAPDMNVALGGL